MYGTHTTNIETKKSFKVGKLIAFSFFIYFFSLVLEHFFSCSIEVGTQKLKLPIEVCRLARVTRYERDMNAEQRTIMLDKTRMV